MRDLALVNGRVVPLEQARVRLLDRGFLLADGVYEVLRSYEGRIFELEAHLLRLAASLQGVCLPMPMPPARLGAQLQRLLRHSGHRDARLYVQVTRGAARRTQAFPSGVRRMSLRCGVAPRPLASRMPCISRIRLVEIGIPSARRSMPRFMAAT